MSYHQVRYNPPILRTELVEVAKEPGGFLFLTKLKNPPVAGWAEKILLYTYARVNTAFFRFI
jgi:hypothetical protein